MKKEFWEFVLHHLERKNPVALITVVESHGASPGKAGFAMAVTANGERAGTIGGGVMEVQWTERAVSVVKDNEQSRPIVKKLFHSRDTQFEPSGLICSGWQTVLLKRLDADVLPVIQSISETFDRHGCGTLSISPSAFRFASDSRRMPDSSFTWKDDFSWNYEQAVGVLDTAFIVGSGHVGLALSRVLATLDLRVVAFDDREYVETFVNNRYAHQKIHCPYGEIGAWISGNEHEYVAVVTTGYKSDVAALRALVNKNVRYIGLMGSPAKTRQIFEDLRGEGITEEFLRRIRSPIGLPIASHTPAEIAVSIAAEIIQLKNLVPA